MVLSSHISKDQLSKLPEEVIRLIGMGSYSLYKISCQESNEIAYVLRTGARELFFLNNYGEPVNASLTNFQIEKRIVIDDISSPFVVSNFNVA
jgi:hypothetical protein